MATNFSCVDIECPVCGNKYDEKAYVPKRLNCPHTLCLMCVNRIVKHKVLKCPLCNKEQKVNVQELATDLATLRLMEVMQYFGVFDQQGEEIKEEEQEAKPLLNADDLELQLPRELIVLEPNNAAEFTNFSKEIYCSKPIDYPNRGLVKMCFKEGHLQKFQCIVDIAHISGNLYILDSRFKTKDTYVHVLQPTLNDDAIINQGFHLQHIGTGCHGIASINDNTFALTNNEYHQVMIFTTKGEFLNRFGTHGKAQNQFRDPRGIAYRNGKLYITDCLNNCISIWSVNGKFSHRIQDEEVMKYPMKIVLNQFGDMFVACCNDFIVVYKPDGTLKANINQAGEAKLQEIRAIHIDHCGNLLVAGKDIDGKNKKKWVWCIDVFDFDLNHVTRIYDRQKKLRFISALTTATTDDSENVIVIGDSGKAAVYFY